MSWIERRLEELAEDGFFEDLPGSGRPIPDLGIEYSPAWWAARWIKRDSARRDSAAMSRRLADDVAAALALEPAEARRRLATIAAAITEINVHLDSAEQLPALDVEASLIRGRWRP